MTLLENVKKLPAFDKGWTKYRQAYFHLVKEKDYPPKEAVIVIAKFEQLGQKEEQLLYYAAKQWKQ